MAEKNGFDITKLVMKTCLSPWCSGQGVACTCRWTGFDYRQRYFLFLCIVFFCLLFFFETQFFLWAVFLYSYCWPCWSYTWINIYFKLKPGVLFWKKDFKSSWLAYWPSLRPQKTISCQDMSLLWNSWIRFFLKCWLTSGQTTHSTPETVLICTQHPLAKFNLAFCTLSQSSILLA